MTDQKVAETKGRAKEATGSLTGDEEHENEGKADHIAAKVKGKVEHAVDVVKEKFTGGHKK